MRKKFNAGTGLAVLAAVMFLTGCGAEKGDDRDRAGEEQTSAGLREGGDIASNYEVSILEAESYSVSMGSLRTEAQIKEKKIPILLGNGTENKEKAALYPGESAVSDGRESRILAKAQNDGTYLEVTLTSETDEDNEYSLDITEAGFYYLPVGEGKHVPASNPVWREYLTGQEFFAPEQLSMPFFAAELGEYAAVVILEDPFHTYLTFRPSEEGKETLIASLRHEYPAIDEDREFQFRIYLTENSPAAVAKCYRAYAEEKGKLVTLEEKAEDNPQIRKLYGAPFVYLWGEFAVSPEDIDWQEYRKASETKAMENLRSLAENTESAKEFKTVSEEVKRQDYVSEYQKQVICRTLSELLRKSEFTKAEDPGTAGELSASGLLRKNKEALAESMPSVFTDPSGWMKEETSGIIEEMRELGIDRAWIGLNSWEQAYANPELVQNALNEGYLVASYDSYHSIHEPGKEEWITAAFADSSLYEEATVTDRDGNKVSGFQNTGRKLNPVFSLPAVRERMKTVVDGNSLPFNSWFIDCDATGEIYDDYTPGHVTTQEEDMEARLDRMAFIRDSYDMVIGSEGGNDFAAPVIAFAHGIELQSFSWMDKDMKENRESPYYLGNYYSPSGGVAERFSQRIPLKEKYRTLFLDPAFDVPLYRLVYNDCVITASHWDWSTFKIEGATGDRMIREILYNVPPLYHLDAREWEEYKEDIVRHTAVWSDFARKAVTREMTGFRWLTEDGLVQETSYGSDRKVSANFSDQEFQNKEYSLPPHSVRIEMDGEVKIYIPQLEEGHE